jgi:hypothetical protein
MPEMNNRSPLRAAKESGGALMPGGAGKCWMAAMCVILLFEHL